MTGQKKKKFEDEKRYKTTDTKFKVIKLNQNAKEENPK